MSAFARIVALLWRDARGPFVRGALLMVAVLAFGVALLGLSGWFITAAAAAGLAGLGAAFNVFLPSGGVRMLALGRTAARYGERLITHDATLRSLARLRVRLLRGVLGLPFARLARLRGAETLNRLLADVDALDGAMLRVVLPMLAGLLVQVASFAMLAWLVGLWVALWVSGSFALAVGLALWASQRKARAPSRRAAMALRAYRQRLTDLLRARDDLAVYGRLGAQRAAIEAAEGRLRADLATLDRIDRQTGARLSAAVSLAAGGALALGGLLASLGGGQEVALVALAFFAALALGETVAPLRRGLADLGRMQDAARRVLRLLPGEAAAGRSAGAAPVADPTAPALALEGVRFGHPGAARPVLDGVSLALAPGEWVALTGASGRGKSTLLSLAGGLEVPAAGRVLLGGVALGDWPEPALRAELGYLPQRATLLGRSLHEMLALGAPGLDRADAETLLAALGLGPALAARGGLDGALGDGAGGLSGGEQRRVALARALLRRPRVLLLDEPTEGLDGPTASLVLAEIRRRLPQAAVLIAAHRPEETGAADRVIAL